KRVHVTLDGAQPLAAKTAPPKAPQQADASVDTSKQARDDHSDLARNVGFTPRRNGKRHPRVSFFVWRGAAAADRAAATQRRPNSVASRSTASSRRE
ncbi:hypothetical protein CA831_28760, partial [Burkholderia multivorans]